MKSKKYAFSIICYIMAFLILVIVLTSMLGYMFYDWDEELFILSFYAIVGITPILTFCAIGDANWPKKEREDEINTTKH